MGRDAQPGVGVKVSRSMVLRHSDCPGRSGSRETEKKRGEGRGEGGGERERERKIEREREGGEREWLRILRKGRPGRWLKG